MAAKLVVTQDSSSTSTGGFNGIRSRTVEINGGSIAVTATNGEAVGIYLYSTATSPTGSMTMTGGTIFSFIYKQ